MHISAELLGKYMKDRKALPAICLNSNISAITAIANDYNYNKIFARQLEGLGKPGDLVFAISTTSKIGSLITDFAHSRSFSLFCSTYTAPKRIFICNHYAHKRYRVKSL